MIAAQLRDGEAFSRIVIAYGFDHGSPGHRAKRHPANVPLQLGIDTIVHGSTRERSSRPAIPTELQQPPAAIAARQRRRRA